MAIQGRLNLSELTARIRREIGETSATKSHITDVEIAELVNTYQQGLKTRIQSVLRAEGVAIGERFNLPFWRTTGTLTTSSGSSTVWFPEDYDQTIDDNSLWDSTNNTQLSIIERVTPAIRRRPPGPPEKIEILGYASNSGTWQIKATVHPATLTGVTPSIAVDYYRLPAEMPNSSPTTEFPDLPPQFQEVMIYGPVAEIFRHRNTTSAHRSYEAQAKEILLAIGRTAESR